MIRWNHKLKIRGVEESSLRILRPDPLLSTKFVNTEIAPKITVRLVFVPVRELHSVNMT